MFLRQIEEGRIRDHLDKQSALQIQELKALKDVTEIKVKRLRAEMLKIEELRSAKNLAAQLEAGRTETERQKMEDEAEGLKAEKNALEIKVEQLDSLKIQYDAMKWKVKSLREDNVKFAAFSSESERIIDDLQKKNCKVNEVLTC